MMLSKYIGRVVYVFALGINIIFAQNDFDIPENLLSQINANSKPIAKASPDADAVNSLKFLLSPNSPAPSGISGFGKLTPLELGNIKPDKPNLANTNQPTFTSAELGDVPIIRPQQPQKSPYAATAIEMGMAPPIKPAKTYKLPSDFATPIELGNLKPIQLSKIPSQNLGSGTIKLGEYPTRSGTGASGNWVNLIKPSSTKPKSGGTPFQPNMLGNELLPKNVPKPSTGSAKNFLRNRGSISGLIPSVRQPGPAATGSGAKSVLPQIIQGGSQPLPTFGTPAEQGVLPPIQPSSQKGQASSSKFVGVGSGYIGEEDYIKEAQRQAAENARKGINPDLEAQKKAQAEKLAKQQNGPPVGIIQRGVNTLVASVPSTSGINPNYRTYGPDTNIPATKTVGTEMGNQFVGGVPSVPGTNPGGSPTVLEGIPFMGQGIPFVGNGIPFSNFATAGANYASLASLAGVGGSFGGEQYVPPVYIDGHPRYRWPPIYAYPPDFGIGTGTGGNVGVPTPGTPGVGLDQIVYNVPKGWSRYPRIRPDLNPGVLYQYARKAYLPDLRFQHSYDKGYLTPLGYETIPYLDNDGLPGFKELEKLQNLENLVPSAYASG